ncbi:4-hydroxy-tetrahydrodipicolinate synthase [Salsuginibacillus halophilus]|uniref:4-hydroxy-tetrahydrodipicolinate synthase n=1 Tax=Salsuginibacillus halophilus TaxID=517424 RepID=A0A2P8HWH2_9BACI|nr:4-hydroxy-tetrahydrodipicolinate synthase [Salsuginibacillus halophilus]PSL50583.1 4-hydroxy-tetrahydrodipicolinate synthase [Salsuginibacillus halophilus]
MAFGRLITAMVTPFDETGEIDYSAVTNIVNHLIQTGTEGVVVGGTTGESPTLSKDEKVALFSHVVHTAAGRIDVIAGTGCNNTRASIELTKQAEACGVSGIMLVAPYYSKPSQEGMYQHFQAIAQATTLPVMLYNIPGRSSVNMSPALITRLAEINNITSVKEASGDLDAAAEIIENTPDDFQLFGGDDSLTLPLMSIGGAGIVSVTAHVKGNRMQEMIQNFVNGNVQEASAIHRELLPVMKAMFSAPSPVPVKAALEMQGTITGDVRLPMIRLTEDEAKNVYSALQPTTTVFFQT